MTFTDAVSTSLQKYATFSGRAGRPEYWWFVLFYLILITVLGWIHPWLGNIASVAMLVPSLSVGARRLHDIGKSGWLQLVWLVPFIGWAIMIYWMVQPSQAANRYGAPQAVQDATAVMPGQ